VSASESYEVEHVAKQTHLPAPLVRKIIEQVGPMRSRVVAKLNELKKNRK